MDRDRETGRKTKTETHREKTLLTYHIAMLVSHGSPTTALAKGIIVAGFFLHLLLVPNKHNAVGCKVCRR